MFMGIEIGICMWMFMLYGDVVVDVDEDVEVGERDADF